MHRPSRLPYSPRRLLTAGTAALLLSSCASFKDIDSHAQQRAPADFAAATSLAAQGGSWPDLAWTESIGGAPLKALVDEALAGNPGLQAAAARVAAAQAVTQATGAAARPAFGASINSTYQRYSEHGLVPPPLGGQFKSDNQLTLNFAYDFDFWGRHAAELRAALSQGKAAEAEQHAARLILTSSIARAWVQLARQHAQLELTRQQLDVRQNIDRLTQLRVKAGLDSQTETQQTRQQLSSLRAEQAQWQEAIALTRNQLAALLGQGPDRGLQIARPVLPANASAALPDNLPLSLLGRRPDIVAARWRVEATLGNIEAAKTQFYPNVNLTAFAGVSSLGLSNLFSSGSAIIGAGPAIRIPLFESGVLRARLKGEVAGYDAAVAAYNQTLTDALRDVADQVQSLRAAADQSTHQQAATQAAANAVGLAQQRERVGTASMLPQLASEMTLLAQRKLDLDLQARRSELRIGLIKSLGGGFDAAALDLAAPASSNAALPPLNRSTPSRSAS